MADVEDIFNGILLVDKPSGITSARVVSTVKKQLNLSRVGHTGTLDPMATGLLLLLIGKATRLARFIDYGFKTYSGKIKLGLVTDSDDITGTSIRTSDVIPSFEMVLQAISNFVGEISQRPPRVSAIKVKGKRSYDLAREGIDVELAPRKVVVKQFLIEPACDDVLRFQVVCSRGTYIRSLARDLGELLGCGGCLKSLRREQIGTYSVANATELDKISTNAIVQIDKVLADWPTVILTDTQAGLIQQGRQEDLDKMLADHGDILHGRDFVLYSSTTQPGRALGILEREETNWRVALNL